MSSASSTKVFNESVEYAQVGTVHSGAAFCIMKAPIPRNGTFRTNTQTETTRGFPDCFFYKYTEIFKRIKINSKIF